MAQLYSREGDTLYYENRIECEHSGTGAITTWDFDDRYVESLRNDWTITTVRWAFREPAYRER